MPPPIFASSTTALTVVFAVGLALPASLPAQTAVLQAIAGTQAGAQIGQAVAMVGDVDADGFDDFAVGTSSADFAANDAGRVVVYSGDPAGGVLHVWDGLAAVDQFGWSVAGAGDTDGDGHADVIVGAIGVDAGTPNSGSATVFSGSDGSVLFSQLGVGSLEVFGWTVDAAGDIDRDGFDDVLIGAPGDNQNGTQSGSVSVYSVHTGLLLYRWVGAEPLAQFGRSAAGVGDTDGDGFVDVLVGAPFADVTTVDEGAAMVFSGATGGLLHTELGTSREGYLGWSVDGCGDMDGDGLADWIAGAPFFENGMTPIGRAQVYSGATSNVIHTWTGMSTPDRLGWSVAGGGDLDADGVPDAVIGSPGADIGGSGVGRVFAVSGATGATLFTATGLVVGDNFGDRVAVGGDSNANGYDEVLIGARLQNVVGVGTNAGSVELLEILGTLPNRARFRSFGRGCVGADGSLPRIGGIGRPVLGDVLTISLDSAPRSSAGLFCLDFQSFPIDLASIGASGCVLRTPNVFGSLILVDQNGRVRLPLAIPNNPFLIGASVFSQWLLVDVDPFGLPHVALSDVGLIVPGF